MTNKKHLYDIFIDNIEELLILLKNSFHEENNQNIEKKIKEVRRKIAIYNKDLDFKVLDLSGTGEEYKVQVELNSKIEKKNIIINFFPNQPNNKYQEISFFIQKENYMLTISDFFQKHFSFEYYTNDLNTFKTGLENLHISLNYNVCENKNELKRIRALKKEKDHFEFIGERALTKEQKDIEEELREIINKENIDLTRLLIHDTEYLKEIQSTIDNYELLTDSNVLYNFIFNTGLIELIKNEDLSFKKVDKSLIAKLRKIFNHIMNSKKNT